MGQLSRVPAGTLLVAAVSALAAFAGDAAAATIYSQDFSAGNASWTSQAGTNATVQQSTASGTLVATTTVTGTGGWYLHDRHYGFGGTTALSTVGDLSQLSFTVDIAATAPSGSGTRKVKIRLFTVETNNTTNQGEVTRTFDVTDTLATYGGTLDTWTNVGGATPFDPSARPHLKMYIDVDSGTSNGNNWPTGDGIRTLTIDNIVFQSIPEPASVLGVMAGGSLLMLCRRRRSTTA